MGWGPDGGGPRTRIRLTIGLDTGECLSSTGVVTICSPQPCTYLLGNTIIYINSYLATCVIYTVETVRLTGHVVYATSQMLPL